MLKMMPALALLALLALPAWAHKVNVFAVMENGNITGEGYFAGGGKAQDVPVEVLDSSGNVVAKGVTGPDGAFKITLPQGVSAPIRIVLKAGDGHQNDFTLTAKDLGESPQAKVLPAPSSGALPIPGMHQVGGAPSAPQGQPDPAQAMSLIESRISALVEAAAAKAVEERLTPLKLELARMAEQERSSRLRDIIGGLGWIIGLVGIVAWFKRPR
jgi:nickel transport protein